VAKTDKWEKISKISTIIAVLGMLSGTMVFYFNQKDIQIGGVQFAKPPTDIENEKIDKILNQISHIENKLAALSKIPADSPVGPKIAIIEGDITTLKKSMESIIVKRCLQQHEFSIGCT
jgi:hypothetical protein